MRVWAFGSNGQGQLGVGHINDISEPQSCHLEIEPGAGDGDDIAKIVAGGNTTYLLFKSGSCFQAGSSVTSSLQSPIESQDPRLSFVQTTLSRNVKLKNCAATWQAFMAVTVDNRLFVSGKGTKGELGLGCDVLDVKGYSMVTAFPPIGLEIIDIAGGVDHVVVVLSDGLAYGWGNGRNGCLGEPSEFVWQPRKIQDVPFAVQRVICGKGFTCLVSSTSEGHLLVLGSDRWSLKSNAPRSVPGWAEIGANWGGIFVLMNDGQMRSWGRSDLDQQPSRPLPLLRSMAVGSEHVVALTDSSILTWGWGEHGNCGAISEQQSQLNGFGNRICLPQSYTIKDVLGVGAGCATSFFWIR